MISIRSAHHIGIGVKDLKVAADWYQKVLGFVEKSSFQDPSSHLKIAYYHAQGFEIEFFVHPKTIAQGSERSQLGPSLKYQGLLHLAFEVEDVDATWDQLQALGIELESPPASNSDLGVRYCFVRDPDGNLIEFLTPLPA